ncbi:hypothetical protein M407DRAFT_18995 [Tulasnella calospora MUT 4182]|uniref:cellulase n=1 Tax=Tulasnella calospora MUT 4182 TaxID=1051891 RepID=A0A0C3QIP2_9AGAM|nr:hypothetical protein M407DRAFT_18995 [Tulasnella calospora MUT 4182]
MKLTLTSLAVLGAALTQVTGQVPVGGQCGGKGWDGFTQLCADGSYCALISDAKFVFPVDFQCLSADTIQSKAYISFILTTLPTFTVKPASPLPTRITGIPTIYPVTTTPCPTVTSTIKVPVTTTVIQPTTITTTATITSVSVVTKTTEIIYTQSCSSTSTTKTTTTTSTQSPPTTTITTRTTTTTDKPCPTNYPPEWAGKNFTYKGANIAGFEWGCFTDGSCPGPNSPPLPPIADGVWQFQWFFKWGMNTFRFPIGWQYVTPTLGGAFDPSEWALYNELITNCLRLPDVYCIIDIHNYARWNGQVIGQSSGVPDAPFIKLWQMIATYYANEPRVIFGLMNEPYKLDILTWSKTLQKVVTAIRAIAPKHVILLPGIEWAHADTFISSGSAAALDAISNPDGSKTNLIFDIHQWLDKANNGTDPNCVTDNVAVFAPLAQWLRCHGRQAFLSATGGGNEKTTNCNPLLCQQMKYLLANSDVFVGYTGWAAGSYDTSYILDETPSWSNPLVDTALVAACLYWP